MTPARRRADTECSAECSFLPGFGDLGFGVKGRWASMGHNGAVKWRSKDSDSVVYLDGFMVTLPSIIGAVYSVALVAAILGADSDLLVLLVTGTAFCFFFLWHVRRSGVEVGAEAVTVGDFFLFRSTTIRYADITGLDFEPNWLGLLGQPLLTIWTGNRKTVVRGTPIFYAPPPWQRRLKEEIERGMADSEPAPPPADFD